FWLNHFSVHQHKADERWLLGDYEERAIRPHALGRFRDLVLATLEHPAMLEYLDNAQNAVGHVNENYARELMERHTLGVDGGYGPHPPPAGLGPLQRARACDLLRGRHPAHRAHRWDGGHVPANRRRHRGDAPHAVPVEAAHGAPRAQIQGPDALRALGGAPRL